MPLINYILWVYRENIDLYRQRKGRSRTEYPRRKHGKKKNDLKKARHAQMYVSFSMIMRLKFMPPLKLFICPRAAVDICSFPVVSTSLIQFSSPTIDVFSPSSP